MYACGAPHMNMIMSMSMTLVGESGRKPIRSNTAAVPKARPSRIVDREDQRQSGKCTRERDVPDVVPSTAYEWRGLTIALSSPSRPYSRSERESESDVADNAAFPVMFERFERDASAEAAAAARAKGAHAR